MSTTASFTLGCAPIKRGHSTALDTQSVPFEQDAASLVFHLVSSRYEHSSLILASNLPFARAACFWGAGRGRCHYRSHRPPRRDIDPRTNYRLEIGRSDRREPAPNVLSAKLGTWYPTKNWFDFRDTNAGSRRRRSPDMIHGRSFVVPRETWRIESGRTSPLQFDRNDEHHDA